MTGAPRPESSASGFEPPDAAAFVRYLTHRALAEGLTLLDLRLAEEKITTWKEWGPFWLERARTWEALGEESLTPGHRLTAGQRLARASLCAHWGEWPFFAYPDVKREGVELQARLFRRAAPLLSPAAESVEIRLDGVPLTSYLRLPRTRLPHPCAVLIGGNDANAEDAYEFTGICAARGLATLAFDGPGQGETLYRGLTLSAEYHRAVSAVIDYLQSRPEIDPERIGALGRSTGGVLAAQATALDKRIRACVVWGVTYAVDVPSLPWAARGGLQSLTGSRNMDETCERTAFMNLQGLAEKISCPLYILHGTRDPIAPLDGARRLAREAKGPTTLVLADSSVHCYHDVAAVVRPAMADWLATQLRAVEG